MKLESLEIKFDKLFSNLKKESFLSMSALGGEIPFYIVPYNPAQENDVSSKTKQLKDRLSLAGISVYEINLFDLALDMLEARGVLDKIVAKESSLSKAKLFKTLQGVLDSETKLIVQDDPKYLSAFLLTVSTREEHHRWSVLDAVL